MNEAPEPKDKLDAAATVVVNGPEDAPFDWHQVDWRRVEDDVRRSRQRIFTASKAQDLKKVRNLQKLMLRSRANTLISVRRVTERNAGRLTAGVDGEVVLTPEAKAKLADRVHQRPSRSRQCRSDACTSPSQGAQQAPTIRDSCDRRSVPPSTGRRPRWNPNGKPGLSRSPMGFGPAAAATTRSRPSTRSSRAEARDVFGRWTPIWRGRSTKSATTTSFTCSAASPPGE